MKMISPSHAYLSNPMVAPSACTHVAANFEMSGFMIWLGGAEGAYGISSLF
jgi:hypothetical protein